MHCHTHSKRAAMIDITKEALVTFNEAAKFLPDGRRPSAVTWWRWAQKGIRGHRLETVMAGGRRMTSAEAVIRFFAALSGDSVPVALKSPHRKERDEKRALAALERDGI